MRPLLLLQLTPRGLGKTAQVKNMAANETEEVDVAKEFNLLPVIFETIQALQKTNDPQEFTKKVLFSV